MQVLGSSFDAFKFPTSEVVQFRALVTPCLPTCEPVVCNVLDFGGQVKQAESYGRRKREVLSFNVDFGVPVTSFQTISGDSHQSVRAAAKV